MNKVTVSGKDGLWARVRSALGGATEGSASTGSFPAIGTAGRKGRPAPQIDDELRRAWAEAAQRKVSLCVLAMEMDGHAEYFSAYGREAVDESLKALEQAIETLLPREDYRCLRNGMAGFVLVLPDMPGLVARELAARIAVAVRRTGLPHRESHAGHVTLSMGLAVVNPQGGMDREVLVGATQAVGKAQRRGIGRLEIVDYRVLADKRQKAA